MSSFLQALAGRLHPLCLRFQGASLRFYDAAAFDLFCNTRSSVPADRLHDLASLAESGLREQLGLLRSARSAVLECLVSITSRGSAVLPTSRTFSKDNAWRDLMSALREASGSRRLHLDATRIALLRYLQYLEQRSESVALVIHERTNLEATWHDSVSVRALKAGAGEHAAIPRPVDDADNRLSPGPNPVPALKLPASLRPAPDEHFTRLPKGVGVELELRLWEPIGLRLSCHNCRLELRRSPRFVDACGESYQLPEGRISVGRDRSNEIVMDASLRDVSRLHLVIEWHGDNRLQLLDCSSYGTYLPSHLKWQEVESVAADGQPLLH